MSESTSQISNSIFQENYAATGGTIKSILSSISISGCEFIDNESGDQTIGVYIALSDVIIDSTSFTTSQTNDEYFDNVVTRTGGYVYLTASSELSITESYFTRGYGSYGGALYFAGDCDIVISTSIFNQNAVVSNGGAIYSNSNNLDITDSEFTENFSLVAGMDIVFISGQLNVSNITFNVLKYQTSMYLIESTTIFENIQVDSVAYDESSTAECGGAMYVQEPTELTITDSSFSNLDFASTGGALCLINLSDPEDEDFDGTDYTITISNTTFMSNSASSGGAIEAKQVDNTMIDNCAFESNNAEGEDFGTGGAIAFLSTSKPLIH